MVRAIELPGVEGRIDHFALDSTGERLFVAALGNNTVEGRRLAGRCDAVVTVCGIASTLLNMLVVPTTLGDMM
jgi:hypothetical protein